MPIDSETIETQRALLALLRSIESSSAAPAEEGAEKRAEPRRPLHAPCRVTAFVDQGSQTLTIAGSVRNIAFSGISVVAQTPGPIRVDRPLEVEVDVAPGQHTHLAGTVAFCRRVTEQCFEIGIAVQAAGSSPILYRDVSMARELYDWFDRALRVRE